MPTSPSLSALRLDLQAPVATLWLDRPDARNAMNQAFFDDLPVAIQAINEAEAVRAVILAAEGPAFCAGLDLKAMAPALVDAGDGSAVEQRQALWRTIQTLQDALTAVGDCRVPVIAAVQGPCIGGGVDLITACDLRLASESATFAVRETQMAMVADLGTLQRLQQIVPQGHVADLVYTGRDIDADRAMRIGLVNDVSPDADALHDAAHTLAGRIAANAPLAVQGAKHVLKRQRKREVQDGLDYVALWNAAFLQSEDLSEALQAFRERRAPQFEGR
jgi:enoyl-CoA hydratase